jgi:hypothetical protein
MKESTEVVVGTSKDRLENEIEWEFRPVHGVPGNQTPK